MLLTDEYFGGRFEPGISTYDLICAALDHQGSVRQLLDSDHDIVEHREFDAFGDIAAVRGETGAAQNEAALDSVFSFAGREWDNDAGLYYNRARWYDSELGRFISEDPIGFDSGDPNLYRYAGNDPVNSRDPSGLTQAGNPLDGLFADLRGEVVDRYFYSSGSNNPFSPVIDARFGYDMYDGGLVNVGYQFNDIFAGLDYGNRSGIADLPLSLLLGFDGPAAGRYATAGPFAASIPAFSQHSAVASRRYRVNTMARLRLSMA